tara:strand:- start:994 stop:1452 length:459 start_codon:yes stop_codon:yes gene_type:complete
MHVKIVDGAVDTYPYTIQNLKEDNPNTSFNRNVSDEEFASYGVLPVTYADPPSYTQRTQYLEQDEKPSLVDGAWTISYTVHAKTDEQVAEYDAEIAANNRTERNYKLSQTDFYALSDVTMSSEMTTYRQALRDITSHSNWPNLQDDDWPTAP